MGTYLREQRGEARGEVGLVEGRAGRATAGSSSDRREPFADVPVAVRAGHRVDARPARAAELNVRAASTARAASRPASTVVPSRTPSHRGVDWRSTTTGTPNHDASSWRPPESVTTTARRGDRLEHRPVPQADRVSVTPGHRRQARGRAPVARSRASGARVNRERHRPDLVSEPGDGSSAIAAKPSSESTLVARCAVNSTPARSSTGTPRGPALRQRVGDGVADDDDAARVDALGVEEAGGEVGGREVQRRQRGGGPAVRFLQRPRVERAQPGFDVHDRHTEPARREREQRDGVRVAEEQHRVARMRGELLVRRREQRADARGLVGRRGSTPRRGTSPRSVRKSSASRGSVC